MAASNMHKCLVPECLSVKGSFECPSKLSAGVPKSFLSAQLPRVPECLSALEVPWECPMSAQFSFEGSSSKKNVWNTTRNGLANSFVEFLKNSQNAYFYIILTVFSFLVNSMYKFYYISLHYQILLHIEM